MYGWPAEFSPRGIANRSWHDHVAGVPFDELQRRHDEAIRLGDAAWGPDGRVGTYAGSSIGLVHTVEDAAAIVQGVRSEAVTIIQSLQSFAF